MITLLRFLGVASATFLVLGFGGAARAEVEPVLTTRDAEEAIVTFMQGRAEIKNKTLSIVEVLGCYPLREPAAGRLCALRGGTKGEEPSVQRVPFQVVAGRWQMLDPESPSDPRCPGLEEAQLLLRKVLHDPALEVRDLPEEGLLTDERGMSRDRKGALRLMCTFGVRRSYGDFTIVAYLDWRNGAFAINEAVESWHD